MLACDSIPDVLLNTGAHEVEDPNATAPGMVHTVANVNVAATVVSARPVRARDATRSRAKPDALTLQDIFRTVSAEARRGEGVPASCPGLAGRCDKIKL